MSGSLGTIPYPLIDQQWQDVPGTSWQNTQQSLPIYTTTPDQSPGWFVPQAMGGAALNPATGRPYLDLSPPPLPADWGSPAAAPAQVAPAPATPQIAEHAPDSMPMRYVGPDGKPTDTPPPGTPPSLQAPGGTNLSATATGVQQPPPPAAAPAAAPAAQAAAPAATSPWPGYKVSPVQPMPIETYQPLPISVAPVAPIAAAVATPPIAQQIQFAPQLYTQMGSGYSAEHEEHERTAKRYRDMLS